MAEPFKPHRWQLAAAEDYDRLGGVFIGLDPGAGKSYALAQIARRCRRPLVVAPASAIPQTRRQFESYGVPTCDAREAEWERLRPGVRIDATTWQSSAVALPD